MSDWRIYIKNTGGDRLYRYRQRNVRGADGKWHTESYSLGPLDPRRKKPVVAQIAIALVGVEDEYANPHDSLLNRMKQEKAPGIDEGHEESAGAGNSEEPSE